MPVLGQQSFVLAPTTDNYVSLANEEFVRQIDWTGINLTNWSTCRVSLHCAIRNTGGGDINPSVLFVGLCSGTSQPYGSSTCLNAVGVEYTGNPWAYNAGANPYYSCSSGRYRVLQKKNTTINTVAAGAESYYLPATGGAIQRRGMIGPLIFTLAATQVTVDPQSEAAGVATSDVWLENFLYGSQTSIVGKVLNTGFQTTGVGKVVTGGAGWNSNPLNAIDIYWASAVYPLDIYAISVVLM
jgi:hypothetical protein